MSSGTKREKNNARDVKTCSACLRTNGAPCAPCKSFIELETQIAQTELLLQDLIAQQDELRTEINTSHEPFIHHLPVELSTRIFELCLPPIWNSATMVDKPVSIPELYAPLYISSVCRTWHQIMVPNPRLWKTIPIYISAKVHLQERMIKHVDEWLRRSGNQALSLRVLADPQFHFTPPDDPQNEDRLTEKQQDKIWSHISSLLELINGQSHRWQNIELVVPVELLEQIRGSRNGAPLLKRFKFKPSQNLGFNYAQNTYSLLIRPAPSMVSITSLRRLSFSWHNLTVIGWDDFCLKECVKILREAPRLAICQLINPARRPLTHEEEPNLDGETPVVCPSLQHLRIVGRNKRTMAKFWNLLTLPKLGNLRTSSNASSLPYSNITEALGRSSNRLTCLFVEYSYSKPSNAEQLLELLSHTPHLTEFVLSVTISPAGTDMHPDPNSLFRFLNGGSETLAASSLARDGVKQLILPNLKTLAIRNIPVKYGPEMLWKSVADLFGGHGLHHGPSPSSPNSRPHHRRPLTRLQLSFSKPPIEFYEHSYFYIDSESVRRFLDLGKTSLDIRVPHPSGDPGKTDDLLDLSMKHFGINR